MQKSDPVSFDNSQRAFASRSERELQNMRWLFMFLKQKIPAKIGTFLLKFALRLHFPVKIFIKKNLYRQFCGGETLEEVNQVTENLRQAGIKSILDYGLEAGNTEKTYLEAFNHTLDTIKFAARDSFNIFGDFKISAIASQEVLQKMQKGQMLSNVESGHIELVKERLDKIGSLCADTNVRIMIDAEESWIQGAINILAFHAMMKFNQTKIVFYNTVQMYRKDGFNQLEDLLVLARKEKFLPAVKLVRGAYHEKERIAAEVEKRENPVFETKTDTDHSFNKGLEFCLINHIALCAGTHNEESTYLLIDLMKKYRRTENDPDILFAQLYGMSDHITYNLAASGYSVAKYIPYGPVRDVIPYLLRRADENKAIAGQTVRELTLIEKEINRRRIKA